MYLARHQDAQGARRHDNPAAAVAVPARRAEAQAQLIFLMGMAWYRARGPWRIAVPLQDDVVVDASPDVRGIAASLRPRATPGTIGHDRMLRDFPRKAESPAAARPLDHHAVQSGLAPGNPHRTPQLQPRFITAAAGGRHTPALSVVVAGAALIAGRNQDGGAAQGVPGGDRGGGFRRLQ